MNKSRHETTATARPVQLIKALALLDLIQDYGQHLSPAAVAVRLQVNRRNAYRWIEAAESLQLVEWENPDVGGGSKGELRRGPAVK